MPEDFDYYLKKFLNNWGQPTQIVRPEEDLLRDLGRKVPANLIRYWRELGFSVFKDGLMLLCNPVDWKPVVDEWIEGTELETLDDYIPIMRGAFGDFYLFGLRHGSTATLFIWEGAVMGDRDLPKAPLGISIEVTLGFSKPKDFDHNEYEDVSFGKVLKKLGPLQPNEIYGFVPMLPMGGVRALEHLQKVDAFAHLSILRQVIPFPTGDIRQMMGYADIYK
jgi:hypothetical protein